MPKTFKKPLHSHRCIYLHKRCNKCVEEQLHVVCGTCAFAFAAARVSSCCIQVIACILAAYCTTDNALDLLSTVPARHCFAQQVAECQAYELRQHSGCLHRCSRVNALCNPYSD